MYPLAETELALHDLVEHWLKHRDDRATASDLISELLKLFWVGDLPLRAPLRDQPWERRELLAMLRTSLPPDEVVQLFAPEDEPVNELVFVFPPRVRLSANTEMWDEAALAVAYAALARWRDEQYPPSARAALTAFLVRRDDFGTMCERLGWPRPRFWFRTAWPRHGVRAKLVDEHACRRWVRECLKANVTFADKKAWRAEVKIRFPNLTGRARDAIWADEMPEAMKVAGRRPKRSS